MHRDIVCVACSVFRPELELLARMGEFDLPVHYLESQLHMEPGKLRDSLHAVLEDLAVGSIRILLYGECFPGMEELESSGCTVRVRGQSCGDILLGRELYLKLLRRRAFLLFPEWTTRWRSIMKSLMPHISSMNMLAEFHDILVYLDTGAIPVPMDDLEELSCCAGIPFEILVCDPLRLKEQVYRALKGAGQFS